MESKSVHLEGSFLSDNVVFQQAVKRSDETLEFCKLLGLFPII